MKKFMTRKAALAVGLIIAAALLFGFGMKCKGNGTARPRLGPVVEAVYALGTVKTDRWYNVRFGMNAIIQKMYVVEGQEVARGAPLVMTDSGIVFRSPFTGTVTQVAYREREMAPGGQPIVTVSSLSDMYIRVSLDQKSIVMVRKGQEAELSFENLRDEKAAGIVESVYPSENEFIVRVAARKFPAGVLPEMTCDTAIVIRKEEKALLVPAASVKKGMITVERKGKRISFRAKTRPVDEKWTEVIDGKVLLDDIIILKGK